MSGSIWDELGIAPTGDDRQIRRAYAQRLKAISPAGDAAAFERLRAAYERALARSGERDDTAGAAGAAHRAAPAEAGPPVPPEGADPEPPPDGQAAAFLEHAVEVVNNRPAAEAIALLRNPEVGLRLSLNQHQTLSAMVKARVLSAGEFQGDTFLALAAEFGWDRPAAWHGGNGVDRVFEQRLNAESWWARINELAASRPKAGQGELVHAARILLGRASTRMAYVRNLAPALGLIIPGDYSPASRLLDRLDPARLAWCKRVALGQDRLVRWSASAATYVPVAALGLAYAACIAFRPFPLVTMAVVFLFTTALRRLNPPRALFYAICIAMVFLIFAVPPINAPDYGGVPAGEAEVSVSGARVEPLPPSLLRPEPRPGDCGPTRPWNPLTEDFRFESERPCPDRRPPP